MNGNSHPHPPIADAATLFGTLPPPPPLMSGDDLYASIMGAIEPDLLLVNMPTIALEMAQDTESAAAERIARYNAALAEYDRRLAEHRRSWDKAYAAYRRASMESLTGFLEAADREHMTDIESQLDSSSPAA